MSAFGEGALWQWSESAAAELYRAFPNYYAAMGASEEALRPMVFEVAKWAQRHEVSRKADVLRLCYVASSLGHRFWQDMKFQSYIGAAMAIDVPSSRRAQKMTESTRAWLRMLWSGDGIADFGQRLAKMIQRGQVVHVEFLPDLLPGYWGMFRREDHAAMLEWLVQTAPAAVRTTPHQTLAYCACALVHGIQWWQDPQYSALADTVRVESDLQRLAPSISKIYVEAVS